MGNIYIADEFPYDVRVINPAGTMSAFANSAYTKSAAIMRGPAATTSLASLYGMAVDGSNNVYAAMYDSTSSSSYIDRVDIATGTIYPVGGQQVTAAPSMATPQLPGTGAKYCAASTDPVGDGCPGTQATFYKPYRPFVDAAGNVYIADQGNDLVRKLSTGTQFPTAAQAVGSAVTQTIDVHFSAGDIQGTYTVGAGFSDFPLGAAASGNGTYGQTETITVTVAVAQGTAVAIGSVIVKVDTSSSTQPLSNGTVTFAVPGLSAGSHTVTASYPGDATSSPSTAMPVTFTLAQAPLNIAVNSFSKAFAAALPTLTGTLTGIVNNDQIGVSYSTTATQSSALGTYPITTTLTGAAAVNYASTVKPGVLAVIQATTTTTLASSSYAVQNTTAVTLTATVMPNSSGTPTGMITFLNGTTPIGSAVPLTGGVATLMTTFAVVGTSTTNVLTAVYSGDKNYMGSTSMPINVVSSFPNFRWSARQLR